MFSVMSLNSPVLTVTKGDYSLHIVFSMRIRDITDVDEGSGRLQVRQNNKKHWTHCVDISTLSPSAQHVYLL